MYLEFACCAAVPGGGRNKEYALHLLNMCHGEVHVSFWNKSFGETKLILCNFAGGDVEINAAYALTACWTPTFELLLLGHCQVGARRNRGLPAEPL